MSTLNLSEVNKGQSAYDVKRRVIKVEINVESEDHYAVVSYLQWLEDGDGNKTSIQRKSFKLTTVSPEALISAQDLITRSEGILASHPSLTLSCANSIEI